MTNREKLQSLTDEQLYDVMAYLIFEYQRCSTNSRLFMIEWLQKQYDRYDSAWVPLYGINIYEEDDIN